MIHTVLKFSEIKKDPVCLLGWDRPAMITRYGDVVAYVISPERMRQLIDAEEKLKTATECINLCKIHLNSALKNTGEDFTAHGIIDAIDSLYDIDEE